MIPKQYQECHRSNGWCLFFMLLFMGMGLCYANEVFGPIPYWLHAFTWAAFGTNGGMIGTRWTEKSRRCVWSSPLLCMEATIVSEPYGG